MTNKLFEIAFSGQIADGEDLQSVKRKIGKIFNADENRLTQMFSGRRVLIKRQADEVTMIKYRGAFLKAGAICEIVELSSTAVDSRNVASSQTGESNTAATAGTAGQTGQTDYVSKYPESDVIPQALVTTPLAVTADKIEDLVIDIAPVGSQMQHQIKEDQEPSIDISGIDLAPPGSDLSPAQTETPPAPPDTTGLTMAD